MNVIHEALPVAPTLLGSRAGRGILTRVVRRSRSVR